MNEETRHLPREKWQSQVHATLIRSLDPKCSSHPTRPPRCNRVTLVLA
jgi:hypothetical protein